MNEINKSVNKVAEIEVLPYFLEVLSEHQHPHKFTQVFEQGIQWADNNNNGFMHLRLSSYSVTTE